MNTTICDMHFVYDELIFFYDLVSADVVRMFYAILFVFLIIAYAVWKLETELNSLTKDVKNLKNELYELCDKIKQMRDRQEDGQHEEMEAEHTEYQMKLSTLTTIKNRK